MATGEVYDIAIIGAGPAGLTAGIYAGRARLKTVIFEKISPGGQIALSDRIENYPGVESLAGYELTAIMEKQARNFGCEIVSGEVENLEKKENLFIIRVNGKEVSAKTVIAATGASPKKLGVEGEKEFLSKGVSYCAVCDGAFFRNKVVAVVGGGNTAVEEAVYLTKFASKVYVIHRRDQLRAEKIVQETAFSNDKIEFIWDTVVEKINGSEKVEFLTIKNKKTGEIKDLKVDGVFIYIGMSPASGLFKNLVDLSERGFIKVDEKMQTKTEGLFAAGDVRDKDVWQVSVAVGDGTIASLSAQRYLSAKFS